MTRDEVRFLLHRLCAAYGRRPPDQITIDEWARALEQASGSTAHRALDSLIANGEQGPNLPRMLSAIATLEATTRPAYVPLGWSGPNERGRAAIAAIKRQLAEMPHERES